MLCRFPADGAYIAQMFLLQRNTARRYAGNLFHLKFTGLVATPHGLDESAASSHFILDFFQGGAGICVFIKIALCFLIKPLMHRIQHACNSFFYVVK